MTQLPSSAKLFDMKSLKLWWTRLTKTKCQRCGEYNEPWIAYSDTCYICMDDMLTPKKQSATVLPTTTEGKKMTTKVFKDSNRTTTIPFENMTLVVTKKDSGGARLRLVQHGVRNKLPKMVTDFFLDASEVAELAELVKES